jgi:hypothetical protein
VGLRDLEWPPEYDFEWECPRPAQAPALELSPVLAPIFTISGGFVPEPALEGLTSGGGIRSGAVIGLPLGPAPTVAARPTWGG